MEPTQFERKRRWCLHRDACRLGKDKLFAESSECYIGIAETVEEDEDVDRLLRRRR